MCQTKIKKSTNKIFIFFINTLNMSVTLSHSLFNLYFYPYLQNNLQRKYYIVSILYDDKINYLLYLYLLISLIVFFIS